MSAIPTKRYSDCQNDDCLCADCPLSSYGRDCHNNPINDYTYARSLLGLSMAKTAELIGMPARTWEDWEAGKTSPPDYVKRLVLDKLRQLANG